MTCTGGSSNEQSTQLTRQKAFAIGKHPADSLCGWRNKLQGELLEAPSNLFVSGED
jgi:hypothetical protein